MPGVSYFRRGYTQIWFLPTVASIGAPDLSSEISVGTDLSPFVDNTTGFSYKNTPIPTPDFSSAFISKIPGEDASDDSSLEIYEKRPYTLANNALRTLLAKNTVGYILIAPGGGSGSVGVDGRKALAATDIVDVWPVIVAGVPRQMSSSNDPARWTCEMTISGVPAVDVAIVA